MVSDMFVVVQEKDLNTTTVSVQLSLTTLSTQPHLNLNTTTVSVQYSRWVSIYEKELI